MKKVGQHRVFSVPEKALCCPIKDFDGRQKGYHYMIFLAKSCQCSLSGLFGPHSREQNRTRMKYLFLGLSTFIFVDQSVDDCGRKEGINHG